MEKQLIPFQAELKIEGKRVLVLAPHPDDEVFGCGGAIMRHVMAGDKVTVIIASDGEFGTTPSLQSNYKDLRRQESNLAAAVLGYGEPTYWGLPDRGLVYGEYLIRRIESAVADLDVDLVYAPSLQEMHPDHRAMGMSAVEAIRRRGTSTKLAMYEVGVPMSRPNLLLDISNLKALKQRAMLCFGSQLKVQAYDQHIGALNRFRTYSLGREVEAAEAYYLVDGDDLRNDVLKPFAPEHLYQRGMGLPVTPSDLPLVSVLIRSMNRPFLKDALDSVALQIYSNIEVLVINASPERHDPLGEWCGSFPLRIVGTGVQLTRSQAANLGLDSASGEYILFLDDDDWLAPNHIQGLLAALNGNDSRRAAYSNVEIRGRKRELLNQPVFNTPFNAALLRSGNYIPIHALLFARTLINDGLRFDEAFSVYEDWDFLLQLSQFTEFVHVENVSAYYRSSGTSGVGVLADEGSKQKARQQIFQKWKARWTGLQIDELVNSVSEKKEHVISAMRDQFESVLIERQTLIDQMSDRNTGLETHIVGLEENISVQQKQMAQQEIQIGELNAQLLDKDHFVKAIETQLNNVLTSTSWRMTTPIRWMGGLSTSFTTSNRRLLHRILGITQWQTGSPIVSQGFGGETLVDPGTSVSSPLVSVIMPVYNACRVDRRFFIKALETIVGQTYHPIELIVVDDGSTDETRQVYENFIGLYPRFNARYLIKENGGQSSARNFGVRESSGEYLCFIDQDDEWYLNKLEKVISWIANNDIDMLYTDSDVIDGDGHVTHSGIHKLHGAGWPHPKRTLEDILFKDIFVMPGLMTIKKSAYEEVGGFDENLSGYEDDDLFLRLFAKFKVFYLPTPTLRWRMYGDNYSFSHRMLTSRSYYWRKLLKNHTNQGTDVFRLRLISLRFFREFMTQSYLQYSAGNELYKKSLTGAKEIAPYLPKFQRVVFFLGFHLPDETILQIMGWVKKYLRTSP